MSEECCNAACKTISRLQEEINDLKSKQIEIPDIEEVNTSCPTGETFKFVMMKPERLESLKSEIEERDLKLKGLKTLYDAVTTKLNNQSDWLERNYPDVFKQIPKIKI